MNTLKADLTQVFEHLTIEGAPAAPEKSQDPFDAIAHEFNVASFGKAYFTKRYDLAKDAVSTNLDSVASNALVDTVTRVQDNDTSETISLMSGQFHDLTAMIKIGALYLDQDALRVELAKIMTADKARQLLDRCMKRRRPSTTYIVSEAAE